MNHTDRYGALGNDENAREAMYWSSDGSQLVVANVSAIRMTILPIMLKCSSTAKALGDKRSPRTLQALQIYVLLSATECELSLTRPRRLNLH